MSFELLFQFIPLVYLFFFQKQMEPTIKENIPNKVTKPKNGIPWITQEIVKKKK